METKNDVIREICSLLDLPEHETTVGSSIPRRFFSDVLDHFQLEDTGDAVNAARALVEYAGLSWSSESDSSNAPSGGGATVTLDGLQQLRQAVTLILDQNELIDGSSATFEDEIPLVSNWSLLEGQKIVRKLLHNTYGGVRQGGISPSSKTKNIFLFTDDASNQAHGYETDHWISTDTFLYCGEGQSGDQTISRYNWSVANHRLHHKSLRLFEGSKDEVKFVGTFELDQSEPYSFAPGIGKDGRPRKVIMFKMKKIGEELGEISDIAGSRIIPNYGVPYQNAYEGPRGIAQSEPFSQDPDLLDKAHQRHSITQNAVANWLLENSVSPLSPANHEPPYDIAWVADGVKYVCEVKGIIDVNEISQIRLGIGQVFDYAQELNSVPVLVVSAEPKTTRMIDVAQKARIQLLWPEVLHKFKPHLRNQ